VARRRAQQSDRRDALPGAITQLFLDCAKMRQKSNSEASEATAVSAVGARHALSSGSPAVDHVLRPRRPTATRDGV
jgi:hypothetical protein